MAKKTLTVLLMPKKLNAVLTLRIPTQFVAGNIDYIGHF
jgi:hypothetical protein